MRHDEVGTEIIDSIQESLVKAYKLSEIKYNAIGNVQWNISVNLRAALNEMSDNAERASTAFTNIVTSLAIKIAFPNIDIRFHQVQIGAPFSFRRISEDVIYPWLHDEDFEGAKSGWQTRTFERPKPYSLDFEENISYVKNAFLVIYDRIETFKESALEALAYLFFLQMKHRDEKMIPIATPNIDDITLIVSYFHRHFTSKGKGVSRLPVLALYALYRIMIRQLKRYNGKELRPLERHSAADIQTHAVGDIEIEESNSHSIFEALEVKHMIIIDEAIVETVRIKILPHQIDRYYILTTNENCKPDDTLKKIIRAIKTNHGTQIIVNGVTPTIQYYLRLLDDPSAIFLEYAELLKTDPAISHNLRIEWNNIVAPRISK